MGRQHRLRLSIRQVMCINLYTLTNDTSGNLHCTPCLMMQHVFTPAYADWCCWQMTKNDLMDEQFGCETSKHSKAKDSLISAFSSSIQDHQIITFRGKYCHCQYCYQYQCFCLTGLFSWNSAGLARYPSDNCWVLLQQIVYTGWMLFPVINSVYSRK